MFFEKRIRPVLVGECYPCHSSQAGEKLRGGLLLDSPKGLQKGGDSGPVVVPGEPENSPLIQAIRQEDPEFAMPPKKKLDAAVVRDFEEWVRLGAPDPRAETTGDRHEPDSETRRNHWSFQPPRRVPAPEVKDASWPVSDVDRFVLAPLEAKSLLPVPSADRRTLYRRIALDLTGLPPTPADVEAFVSSHSSQVLEDAIDQFLASPRFGEKWARHWLDVARYAESTGKTVNFSYPHAWRYRDYVIAAFNSDKPFDQFIKEQLAGDLLPTDDPKLKAERMIATGFLALGPKTLNERSGLKFELDVADEQIDVTTQAFLGITVACARCHDHKFDPIPQTDYYALAGIFRSTETCYGTVSYINAQRTSPLLSLPLEAHSVVAASPLSAEERQRVERQIQGVRDSSKRATDGLQKFFASGQISLLQARLDAYDDAGNPKLLAMGVRDKAVGPEPRRRRSVFGGPGGFSYDGTRTIADSPVYARGESDHPSDTPVSRGALRVLPNTPLNVDSTRSGRLELAEWIASPENPLTARVLVNRVWLQLFGKGLVPTADDFGLAGRPPTHPELLDHLALRFWSIKKLIKYLMLSRVYQLSSKTDPTAADVDPDNSLLWRMAPRRLDAESLRDAVLAVSGQLNSTPPVGSVVARTGEGPLTRPRFGGDPIAEALNDPRNNHRSIYLPVIRDNLPESMSLFDAADPSLVTADRPQTTVPSQGLYLLNNAFVMRGADAAAERLLSAGSESERIREAYSRFFARPPTDREQTAAEAFLKSYRDQISSGRESSRSRELEVWSAFCQALFASAEFQYR
ncbi:MAG: PSD1 and planctomycete cytochrome C domain-containing protein [Planctomycetota bacterium]|nr:PSD1 and planctomycete cytochrome C domain-containing protein [Planctomycetota bacterium]